MKFVSVVGTLLVLSVFSNGAQGAKIPDLPWSPLPKQVPAPKDNPTTKEKVELGKQLFFDPRISSTGTVSCNSCHNVMAGGDDNRPTSFGIMGKVGGRSAPTVWNSAFHSVQFWDGRAFGLEAQAIGPMTNPVEMGMANHDMVMGRINEIPGYVASFKKAFGGKTHVTLDNAARAIAAYERTLVTTDSPFDLYMKGNKKAISAQAEKGMHTVIELGCITCHNGPNFNGTGQAAGEGFYQRFPTFTENDYVKKYDLLADKGRFEATKNEDDEHFFRVPTWRNIALTAPYFHNGSVPTLEEAVRVMAKVQLDRVLTDQQVGDIVAFLTTLSGKFPVQTMPRLPETPGKTFFNAPAGTVTAPRAVTEENG